MKATAQIRWALALIAGVGLHGAFIAQAADDAGEEAIEMMSSYESQQRTAEAARAKDPAWKPECKEVALIQVGDKGSRGALRNFCLNREGNILACYVPGGKAAATESGTESGLRIYSPEGKLLKTMPLAIKPTAVCVAPDGAIFAAGEGKVVKLDAEGKELASAVSPVADATIVISKEMEEMAADMAKQARRSASDELARMKTMLEKRRADVTGLTATDQDVFVAVPSPTDFSYRVYRLDQALQKSVLVVDKLRGCCGQMDIQSHDGKLWIPHNARHRVEQRDREGEELSQFGKAGRVKASDFGGCCEPKNMRVLPNGDILAAESGPPTCIKRFSAEGKFLGVVASVPAAKGDCVRVTVEMSPDGSRYYMLDTTRDAIRVFSPKG